MATNGWHLFHFLVDFDLAFDVESLSVSQSITGREEPISAINSVSNAGRNFTKIETQTSFSTYFGGKLRCIPFLLFLERFTPATYIFTAPIYTTTMISFEPLTLNA